jgi:HAD superfamily hydrolase (TIGR01549 family)
MPDNKKTKTIIFDFDGTLADTLPVVIRIFNRMMVENGRAPIGSEDLELWRQKGVRKFLADINLSIWRAPKYLRDIQKEMTGDMGKIPAFPGMEQLLQNLHQRGYQLGLVSTNIEKNIEVFFQSHHFPQFDLNYYGSAILGKARVLKGLLKKYDVQVGQALYVGDETRDIEAARAIGLPIIAVTWGYNNEAALKSLLPQHLASTSEELDRILSQYF